MRKVIGVSEDLHEKISGLAKSTGLPMTVLIDYWVDNFSEQDWDSVKQQHEGSKPTWSNMRDVIQDYQSKYPDADDKKLSELSGYSIAQVETITHTAHKRVLAYMKKSRSKPEKIADQCGVSVRFVKRIQGIVQGTKKPSKNEAYLFEVKK